jgi:hypothetical protein
MMGRLIIKETKMKGVKNQVNNKGWGAIMFATTFKSKSGSLSKESFLTKEQHEQCKEIVE